MWKYTLAKYEICKNCKDIVRSGLDVYRCYNTDVALQIASKYTVRSAVVGPYNIACRYYEDRRVLEIDR